MHIVARFLVHLITHEASQDALHPRLKSGLSRAGTSYHANSLCARMVSLEFRITAKVHPCLAELQANPAMICWKEIGTFGTKSSDGLFVRHFSG